MKTSEILSTFVDFYGKRGHRRIGGSTLIPTVGDPVLFTTSGMHSLTPYLEGRPHPLGSRLLNVQRCLRTTDLDDVGDPWHLTVFQMLGTWSLGDYDGTRSQQWGYEFLVDRLGIDPSTLHATVFAGDDQVSRDEESATTWERLGIPVEYTVDENWWSNGPTGPCGPDTELFVWTGEGPPRGQPTTDPGWVELWNHVSMRYRRFGDGSLEPLEQPNVDTGMGLERLVSVIQDVPSVFDTDLLTGLWREVGSRWLLSVPDQRVVTDHVRASIVVVGDGVVPTNTGRGYVLRRLVRRLLTLLWTTDRARTLADLPIEQIRDTLEHGDQSSPPSEVQSVLLGEEQRFRSLVDRGERLVSRELTRGPLDDNRLRYLHETHGLPPDLVTGLLVPGLALDEADVTRPAAR